jgi:hypothetical protein
MTIYPLCVPNSEEPLLHRRIEFLWRNGRRASIPCILFSLLYGPADANGEETLTFRGWHENVTLTGRHLLAVFDGLKDGTLEFVAETGASEETPWPSSAHAQAPCITSITLTWRDAQRSRPSAAPDDTAS